MSPRQDVRPPEQAPTVVRRTPRHRTTRREHLLSRAIVLVTVATVTARSLWLTRFASVPKGPDAIGPWAAAFAVVGEEPSITMRALPPYSVGLGVLLAPLVALVEDPETRFRAAVALLSLSSLLSAWLVSTVAARWARDPGDGERSPLVPALALCVGAALPVVSYSAGLTWVEPLAYLWLAAWAAGVCWTLRSPSWWSLLVAALSGTAVLVHGRMALVPLVFLTGVVVSSWDALRRGDRGARVRALWLVAANVAVVGVVTVLARAYNQHVIDLAWVDSELAARELVVGNIAEPRLWRALVVEAVGQLWYATASTFGLAPVGAAALVALCAGRVRRLEVPLRRVAGIVLAGLAAVVAIGALPPAVSLMDNAPLRLDYVIYGRYAQPAFVTLAVIGAAFLCSLAPRERTRWLAGAGIALVVSGALIRAYLVLASRDEPDYLGGTVMGVEAFPLDRAGIDVVRWSAFALVVLVAITVAGSRSRTWFAAAVAGFVLVGGSAGGRHLAEELQAWDNTELYAAFRAAGPPGGRILVSDEAYDSRAFLFNAPTMQYAIADQGWDVVASDRSAESLGAAPPEDAAALVLPWDRRPSVPDWCRTAQFIDVVIWTPADSPIVHGGDCTGVEDTAPGD